MAERAENIGVKHGRWGEEAAVRFLEQNGYEIIERNVRPLKTDRRLEIDIVAYDKHAESVVFVEVKQHAKHKEIDNPIRGVDAKKKRNMRLACKAWCWANNWKRGMRFDVIEVYGVPESGEPDIQHFETVNIFTPQDRFVEWM